RQYEYFNPVKARCKKKAVIRNKGNYECYAIAVGNKLKVKSSYFASKRMVRKVHSKFNLLSALYFVDGNLLDAKAKISNGVDLVLITMPAHPKCRAVNYGLIQLSATLIGPGSFPITAAYMNLTGWREGEWINYNSITQSGEIKLTDEYLISAQQSRNSAIGIKLITTANTTCTPNLIQYSLLCDRVEANAVFFKNGSIVFTWTTESSKIPILLPLIKDNSPQFFESFVGCINYSA
ncbi:hypothetical protein L0F63_007291, partial [Massospora cicadina]